MRGVSHQRKDRQRERQEGIRAARPQHHNEAQCCPGRARAQRRRAVRRGTSGARLSEKVIWSDGGGCRKG